MMTEEVAESLVSNDILLNIAQLLAIQLPDGRERIIANKWIKKFLVIDSQTRNRFLPLFVYSLQQKFLVKPFNESPGDLTPQWTEFEREYTIGDIRLQIAQMKTKDILIPPYKVDISQDMKEFATYQEIPNFGAHFYFAISSEPITEWNNFSKLKVPIELAPSLFVDDELKKMPEISIPKIDGRAKTLSHLKRKPTVVNRPDWQPLIEEAPEPEVAQKRKGFLNINFDDLNNNDVRVKLPLRLQKRLNDSKKIKE